MGRTEPSIGRPPPTFRKNQRAKKARDTLNKTIPALLVGNARARDGVAAAELILQPAASRSSGVGKRESGRKRGGKRSGKRRAIEDEEENDGADVGGPAVPVGMHEEENDTPPNVRVLVTDTLTAAAILNRSITVPPSPQKRGATSKNVAILNMASPLRPGGGFLSGATSQEEFLCMRTTLYPSLREQFYRLPEVGAVWSPNILVFRNSSADAADQPQQERFWVDAISAAALRFPEVELKWRKTDKTDDVTRQEEVADLVYADKKDADLLRRKIKAVLQILRSKGVEQVVLGAWGCGAYGNPIGENARAWKEILLGLPKKGDAASRSSNTNTKQEKWFGLKEVVFAITQPRMAEDFARSWGSDLGVETPSIRGEYDDENDDLSDQGSDGLEEIRVKIAQLESQIANVKTPVLKTGLEAVLQRLTSELDAKSGVSNPSKVLPSEQDSDADENETQDEDD
ncbi:hypothetical protein NA57DRAFT_70895 [Rhizodiscina lignyota]|uniref:Microbial-type PARG catalytic domain-containing protein n=1 Tax=Rhizodiscina lignyota TaxID=1504668 RepID=A0A9P4IUI2_9PEZI|nr:hypothetical protein NA57DRAFT_70895 [Rhizodiscina lignyota]